MSDKSSTERVKIARRWLELRGGGIWHIAAPLGQGEVLGRGRYLVAAQSPQSGRAR